MNYLAYIGHGVSWGRSGEKQAVKRLEGLVFMPQEWHKKKVILRFVVTSLFMKEVLFIRRISSFIMADSTSVTRFSVQEQSRTLRTALDTIK